MLTLLLITLGIQQEKSFSQQLDTPSIIFACKVKAAGLSKEIYGNEHYLTKRIANFSAKILNSKGFDNAVFVKITVRNRGYIENLLFTKALSNSEKKMIGSEPDQSKFDSLKNHILIEKYGYNEYINDDSLIAHFPDIDYKKHYKGVIDVFYFLCIMNNGCIIDILLINPIECARPVSENMARSILKETFFAWEFSKGSKKKFEKILLREQIPEVEEIGIDFLFLPRLK